MPGGKVQLPPVYKRLLSLRWFRPPVENESIETTKQWKNLKHGNTIQQKQGAFADRNGGLTKEQINFLIFRAGRETPETLFHATQDGAFFPDIAPQMEHFKEEDIRQIQCMLSRSYRSYKVDTASVWKMLYYAELLMKGYTLQRLVSRGDFGVVYSATLNGVNCKASVEEEIAKDGATTVGIKIIDKSDTHWYQVRNEIAAHASTSDHPNVLKLYQVFHTATATYLVQEFAERGSLESIIPRKGFTEQECRNLMKGILHGLRHLQRLDVVHRNLTCANILLTSQGTVKIAEFGLACVLPERDFLLHQKVGTSGYMAPEVLRGLRYNGFLADNWTIGIVLYFLLHKFLPFTDEDLILYNCWHCLDFTHRSLSVELCLLLRSILQFRPTQRPSVENILRHDWFAQDAKPRSKSQVKDNVPPRPSIHPDRLNERLTSDPQRSPSVQSVEGEPQKRDLGGCWANLMHSDGLNNERITLKSRLISYSQQDKINRLERKLKARSKNKDRRTPTKASSSLKKGVLPELGSIHQIEKLPVRNEGTGAPINVPPGQMPTAPMLPTSAVSQTPTDVVSHEPDQGGHGHEKGVFCTALKCLRELQQERMLFETTSSSLKSSLIQILSLSEDDEDNYERDRNEEKSDKETKTKKLEKDQMEKNRDTMDKISEKKVENKDSAKKIDEEMTISGTWPSEERRIEKSLAADEDTLTREGRLSQQSPRGNRESVASLHQEKEESSERRLIVSIRTLNDSVSSDGSNRSVITPTRSSEDDEGSWTRMRFYAPRPSLEPLDEVPAEYAHGLDIEDEETERLIRIQYYNQMDLPSTADDPLEAEQHETFGPDSLQDSSKSVSTIGSVADNVVGDTQDGTPTQANDEATGGRVKLVISDDSPSLFHPELAIQWDAIAGVWVGPDSADIAGQKEIKTKSRTTVVSKAPSLRAITEEHLAAGKGGLLEKSQAQENLRKTDSFGKRAAESKTKSKDHLLSSSSSSIVRLMAQSQIQIQEERSESAVWESISSRGVARGSYPKLAASFACETSLHSIVELATEKDAERLEQENNS